MEQISILDSTLRDGAQGIGISFSVEDKLRVVELLVKLGIGYIEAGNPYSNPKELQFFSRLKGRSMGGTRVAAFGSTRRKNIPVAEDDNLRSLLRADTKVCTIFGKSSKFHVERVLETDLCENLNMIEESCSFLKSHGKEVIYDAEHFFDGYKLDPTYAVDTVSAAIRGGADLICLCDTNGGAFPAEITEILKRIKMLFEIPIGVHFHNDCGLAAANSLAGVMEGACHVQGTLLGFGERCGNANLVEVIGNLQLKLGRSCIEKEGLQEITQIARGIAAVANISLPGNMPYVGKNAFAHKAGMHAAGVFKDSKSFEHIDPALVGNQRRFPASEISGKNVVLRHAREIFPDFKMTDEHARGILSRVKVLEMDGYQFEGAEASFELLIRKSIGSAKSFFKTLYYRIYTNYPVSESEAGASAVVKIKVQNKVQLMAGEGNGPVNALDQALRKALEIFYPVLSRVKLTDYKVRVLDGKKATAARVRVLITSSIDGYSYTTVGVSGDVVAASWKALEDSIEYLLINYR